MSSAHLPITRQTVGRTFIAAISLLGVGALVQVGVVGWLFWARFRADTPADGDPARANTAPGLVAERGMEDLFADAPAPATPAATPEVVAGPTPPLKLRPSPVLAAPATTPVPPTENDRFTEVMEQARMLRGRGDVQLAITKFREAQAMRYESAEAAAELAATYEKAGIADKAAETWRRVYEMGESAGVFYSAAEGKLRASQVMAMRQAEASNRATPPPVVAPVVPATPAPAADVPVGLSATTRLGLGSVSRQEVTEPNVTRKFALQVPVRAKARTRLDPREVIVQVLFYDAVNNRALERTTAEVQYQWTKPPADWLEDDTEVLQVTYTQPLLRVADEERKYYGYIVSIYYKNVLQDYRSEPAELAERAAPPKTLSPDSAQ